MTVTLRPVVEADLDAFFEFERDPEAVRMAAFTAADPSDRAAFDVHWARILADPQVINWAIEDDGRVVGNAATYVTDGEREVTFWVDRAEWGRGVASAALALMLAETDERPLVGRCVDDNAGSLRVLEKHGFVVVGSAVDFAAGRGENVRELLLRLDV